MSEIYDIRRFGGDKIALLAIFAISLVTAHLVAEFKSSLVLSAPIRLSGTGLSVSVPIGRGWQSRRQWDFKEGARVLSSRFTAGTGEATARVICRYRRSTDNIPPNMLFEQRAREFDGQVRETGRLPAGMLVFEWARVEGLRMPITVFLGTTVLPDGRQFDVEVYEVAGDAEQAEQAFRQVIESVDFADSRLHAAAGGEGVSPSRPEAVPSTTLGTGPASVYVSPRVGTAHQPHCGARSTPHRC